MEAGVFSVLCPFHFLIAGACRFPLGVVRKAGRASFVETWHAASLQRMIMPRLYNDDYK